MFPTFLKAATLYYSLSCGDDTLQTTKLFSLILHNCDFAIVINCYVNFLEVEICQRLVTHRLGTVAVEEQRGQSGEEEMPVLIFSSIKHPKSIWLGELLEDVERETEP